MTAPDPAAAGAAITSLCGAQLPTPQRFAQMRRAGFCQVMMYWGTDSPAHPESRAQRVRLARQAGLRVLNAHATSAGAQALWEAGAAGDALEALWLREVQACAAHGVDTLVLHLVGAGAPPPVSAIGLARLERLTAAAMRAGVRLALENTRSPLHVQQALRHLDTPWVGLCYDTGHALLWAAPPQWLRPFAGRVFAVHLQDGLGARDDHLLPFEGVVDWPAAAAALAACGYAGPVALEPEPAAVEGPQAFGAYLARAAAAAARLQAMLEAARARQAALP